MKEYIDLKKEQERQEKAVLVAVRPDGQTERETSDYLDELAFLASTANIETKNFFIQNVDRPDPRTFVRSGKLEEIAKFLESHEIDTVIFDDDLTPSQVRNISGVLKEVRIIDRSLLILEIFSMRAQTAQSRLQVELAQFQYVYPRLTKLWTHLSRQRGGGTNMRGAGEKELETDRRIVRDRIAWLKKKLSQVEKQAENRRRARERMVRVAIVGYTNVGKSTLMNRLTKSGVFAENKLFATVDSTVRRMVIDGIPFLISDTVGFIRKLPTHLIESFKSTLDEIREAHILVHVVDGAHPALLDHIKVVNEILKDLESADKPQLLLVNKIDLVDEEKQLELKTILDSEIRQHQTIFISATEKLNLGEFRSTLGELAQGAYVEIFPNHLTPQGYYTTDESEFE